MLHDLHMLQAPLQPLQDNLESQTYETFEKDRTKYDTYEAAIHAALLDEPQRAGQEAAIIMVVGAGRGPLITASLQVNASQLQNSKPFSLVMVPFQLCAQSHRDASHFGTAVVCLVMSLCIITHHCRYVSLLQSLHPNTDGWCFNMVACTRLMACQQNTSAGLTEIDMTLSSMHICIYLSHAVAVLSV